MSYLILSDLHANREALDAVLEDARAARPEGYQATLCLGDLVGYGADPAYTIRMGTNRNTGGDPRQSRQGLFGPGLPGALQRSCAGLGRVDQPDPRSGASGVSSNLGRGPLHVDGFDLVHGSPRDEDEYLVHSAHADEVRNFLDGTLTFFGHTHVQGGFLLTRGGTRAISSNTTLELEPDHFYLINPGFGGPAAGTAIHARPMRFTIRKRRWWSFAESLTMLSAPARRSLTQVCRPRWPRACMREDRSLDCKSPSQTS